VPIQYSAPLTVLRDLGNAAPSSAAIVALAMGLVVNFGASHALLTKATAAIAAATTYDLFMISPLP